MDLFLAYFYKTDCFLITFYYKKDESYNKKRKFKSYFLRFYNSKFSNSILIYFLFALDKQNLIIQKRISLINLYVCIYKVIYHYTKIMYIFMKNPKLGGQYCNSNKSPANKVIIRKSILFVKQSKGQTSHLL